LGTVPIFFWSKQEKSINRLKAFIFLFVIVQGAFYLFLIPPWQSPDESHQFAYGALLSKDIKLTPLAYENLDKKIVESMDTFNAWKYQFIPSPSPLPHRLSEVPFFAASLDAVSGRAPLYYLLSSFSIKGIKINGILNQFYLIRIFSFVLYLFSVYFTYLSAKLVFKDNIGYTLAGVCFVGLLPQFLIISTSVNPVNLAVFLGSVFLYVLLYSLYKGKNLIAFLLGPVIIAIGLFNHHAALFMIPPFLVYFLIVFIQSLKTKREFLKFMAILMIILFLCGLLYFGASHFYHDSLLKKVPPESAVKSQLSEMNSFIRYFSIEIYKDISRSISGFLDGFFKSFWYFAGWLRFGYLVDIYSILKIICLFSIIGIFKYIYSYIRRRKVSVDFRSFLILIAAGLPIILGTLIHCFPSHFVAQGRYIFPAISALAILFVLGLREIVPKRLEKWLPIFIIIGFIVLNIYTLFNSLIRVFYYFTNA
jgi:hypothetical protein